MGRRIRHQPAKRRLLEDGLALLERMTQAHGLAGSARSRPLLAVGPCMTPRDAVASPMLFARGLVGCPARRGFSICRTAASARRR